MATACLRQRQEAYLSTQVSVQVNWRQGTQLALKSARTRTVEGVRYRQPSHDHEITLMTLALKRT